jgi:hypothetical protein
MHRPKKIGFSHPLLYIHLQHLCQNFQQQFAKVFALVYFAIYVDILLRCETPRCMLDARWRGRESSCPTIPLTHPT